MTLFPATEPDVVELVLPWPPSVNNYFIETYSKKHKRVFKFVGEAGVRYRKNVLAAVLTNGMPPKLRGHLKLEGTFHPPDERKRDLDNLLKSLLDAMQEAGVYGDDCQIREMDVRFGMKVEGGRATIKLTTLGM